MADTPTPANRTIELKRVVVTGLGAVTPIGNTTEEYWQGLVEGRSGIGPITHFDASRHGCQIAAEVKDFEPSLYLDRKEIKRNDRFVHFAIASASQAMEDSGLPISEVNAEQVGVLIGTGIGGIKVLEDQQTINLSKGPGRCSPFMIPMMIANMATGQVAIKTGAKGPSNCTVTACAAGANAIGDAFRIVQRGDAQAMIAGGTEAAITELSMAGFSNMKAMSTRNDEPDKASRPFDKDRDGFVMGEGSGVLVLEELEHAKARGAKIYAEIVGYGLTCDAFHITAPSEGGEGAARAMRFALKDGGISPADVSYINAHGTSTPANDINESAAIQTVLGEHAHEIAVSSTKSMTGHLLGGSGGIEAVASVLSVARDRVPPTLNHDNPGEGCDLDYVPYNSRPMTVNVALSNSLGFGGHNVTLAFRKYRD